MKVLVVGGGGREHTLAWKIAQSPLVEKVFCTPGNAGIAAHASCVPMSPEDQEGLVTFVKDKQIDLTVVGPEAPLVMGIVDRFREDDLAIIGPSKAAAQLEGSKVFSKNLMHKYNIPTGFHASFTNITEAESYVRDMGAPIVVKADGLAAGKGVIVCNKVDKAIQAIHSIMVDKAFGDAGNAVVIEEYLTGEEASFIALTDGKTILPLATSQDHKQLLDDDKGPNTGGMGAYSPALVIHPKLSKQIMEEIMLRTIKAMASEGAVFQGFLYAGIMITDDGPRVLEFNVRMGDPEAQPVLTRMKSDIVPIFQSILNGDLKDQEIEWDDKSSVCVVLASEGYPKSYQKGFEITGLNKIQDPDVVVFHAGTAMKEDKIVTSGGRVLGVTGLGYDLKEAIRKTYASVDMIDFKGKYFRKDIGQKGLKRQPS